MMPKVRKKSVPFVNRSGRAIQKPDTVTMRELIEDTARSQEERLTEVDVKKFMQLSRAEIEILNKIASGRPPRNAMAIMAAIKMKLEHTVKKPGSEDSKAPPVTVVVNSLADKPEVSVIEAPAPSPTPEDLQ